MRNLIAIAALVAATLPAQAGRKDAPPAEPSFVDQIVQMLGRRDFVPQWFFF